MSSPIPGSSVRIASSLVSAGAADFVVPASEGVPTPPPDTYVRMSERDPRDKLGVVVEGGEGRKALGISWETASPLEKAGIVLVSSFIGIGILFGALQARRKSDIMGVWQLPDAPPDGKAEPPKLTPASLYDTSHMESYEGWVQQTIRAKWTSLKPEQQLAAVQDELKLTLGAASEIPSDPPSLWAIRLSRIVAESSSAGTGDLTTADGLLEHAMAIKSAGIELERLYLYQDAANMTAAAARAFEGLAGKQLEAVDAYRFVARNAEAAGDAAQAAFANREADRVWIRERLQQIFAVEKEIIGDADPKATAAAVALRIVEAPELAERFLRRDAPDKEGRFARPVLREQWRTVVTSVLKEIDAGLAPTWRSGIVDYLYGAEEPAYREYQKEWWYA